MKFELVLRTTHNDGTVSEEPWIGNVESFVGLYCPVCQDGRDPVALEDVYADEDGTEICGLCDCELVDEEMVICPQCEEYVLVKDFPDHLGEGCEY